MNNYRTEASKVRMRLAEQIASTCPSALFDTIAITGSTARGIADDASDIEVNIWMESIPSAAERSEWLGSIGAQNLIVHTDPRPDQSIWINGFYYDYPLEVGWQRYKDLNHSLDPILQCKTVNHHELMLADIVVSAIALREKVQGRLADIQATLAEYPAQLQTNIIAHTLSSISTQGWYPKLLTHSNIPIHRKVNRLSDNVERCLRIVFAINQQWEPNWKWIMYLLPELKHIPDNFNENLQKIYTSNQESTALRSYVRFVHSVMSMLTDNEHAADISEYLDTVSF